MGIGGMGKLENDDRGGREQASSAQNTGISRDKKEDWIGRQLRRVFDDAVSEPLPDDIMSLLERIDSESPSPSEPETKSD